MGFTLELFHCKWELSVSELIFSKHSSGMLSKIKKFLGGNELALNHGNC